MSASKVKKGYIAFLNFAEAADLISTAFSCLEAFVKTWNASNLLGTSYYGDSLCAFVRHHGFLKVPPSSVYHRPSGRSFRGFLKRINESLWDWSR